MRDFLAEFVHDIGKTNRVIFIDDEGTAEPRQYRVRPIRVLGLLAASAVVVVLLTAAVIVLTPLRELIPGYGTEEMHRDARLNALRLSALEDSLASQAGYVSHLRNLITGQLSTEESEAVGPPPVMTNLSEDDAPPSSRARTSNWRDHSQPAFRMNVLPVTASAASELDRVSERYLASLRFPVLPPLEGFFTRGFEARIGHFGIDIAAQEGSVVRSVGDGYVVFADWTHEGGHALAIQHAEGYISVYKHNERLLKNVGDRVRDREPIALSGNSGEITTGPHLHFELWQNGLAQDPSTFFLSL